jgi:hypothetical protein
VTLTLAGTLLLNLIYIGDQLINCHGSIGKVLIQAFITHHDIIDDTRILVGQFNGFHHLFLGGPRYLEDSQIPRYTFRWG